jgi:CheY-like chemotaxis protein
MPQIDGPTTAKRILDLYQQLDESSTYVPPNPHIVCLTAFTEKIFENKARESGMNEFVSKPITNMRLKQILRDQRLISLADAFEEF